MKITKKSLIVRGLNKLDALKGFTIGIPSFDDRFRIRAGDETAAREYLLENNRYTRLEPFFQWGFARFQCNEWGIFLIKMHYTKADLQPDRLRMYLEQVCRLIEKQARTGIGAREDSMA